MDKYQINLVLRDIKKTLSYLQKVMNLSLQEQRAEELSNLINSFAVSDDWQKFQKANQEFKYLSNKLNKIKNFQTMYDDLSSLLKFSNIEQKEDLIFLEKELLFLQKNIHNLEIEFLFNQSYDINNAILTLNAGSGGIDAQDWCEMLLCMYQKYLQRKKFQIEILDFQIGDVAGVKHVTLLIKGLNVYGYLKSETGIHRLVRISPFNKNSKRHTSFVSCQVLPQIDNNITINIKEEDLKFDFFKSSGAGGQHVNTTDSAVRLTHLPTNVVINCQDERSQIRNKEKALKILKNKLLALEIEHHTNHLDILKGEKKDISWGRQIRSYIFNPYTMVKDHRTKFETFQIENIMNGCLDEMILTFLKWQN